MGPYSKKEGKKALLFLSVWEGEIKMHDRQAVVSELLLPTRRGMLGIRANHVCSTTDGVAGSPKQIVVLRCASHKKGVRRRHCRIRRNWWARKIGSAQAAIDSDDPGSALSLSLSLSAMAISNHASRVWWELEFIHPLPAS